MLYQLSYARETRIVAVPGKREDPRPGDAGHPFEACEGTHRPENRTWRRVAAGT